MPLHFVFTRYEGSFISRAIMWFEWPRGESARRCSHGIIKFWPEGPIFKDSAASAEAMEKGCWMNFFEKSIGRQEIVADFRLRITDDEADQVMRKALLLYNDWNYDFFGVGQNAIIILMKRWFGSLWRWFQMSWKLRKGEKELFCTGYLYNLARLVEVDIDPSRLWTGGITTPRAATPRTLINACFAHPECYEWIGGSAKP